MFVWPPSNSLSIQKPGRLLSALAIKTPIRWPICHKLLSTSWTSHLAQTVFLRYRLGAEFWWQAGERVLYARARALLLTAGCIVFLRPILDFTHDIPSTNRSLRPPEICFEGRYSFSESPAQIMPGIRQGFSEKQRA